jgi:hypothetical protein
MTAGLVTALYPPLPYLSALVLTETLTTFLVTAAMVLWLRALRDGSLRWFLATGLVCAATALTRPTFQFLPLFLVGASVLATPDARRLRWRGGLVMLAAFFAAVLPWLAYNVVYFKTVTFSPAGGPGRQLFEGTWQVQLPGRLETELTAIADSTPDRATLDERVRAVAARSQLPAEPMLRHVHQHQDIRRIWTEPTDPWERVSSASPPTTILRVGLENIRENPVRHAWRRPSGNVPAVGVRDSGEYSDINRLSPLAIRAIWLPQVGLMLLATWGAVVLGAAAHATKRWRSRRWSVRGCCPHAFVRRSAIFAARQADDPAARHRRGRQSGLPVPSTVRIGVANGYQLIAREPVSDQDVDLTLRVVERRHDHQLELDIRMCADVVHAHAEELARARPVEDGCRLQPVFLQREVRQLGGFAGTVDREALRARSDFRREREVQLPARLLVKPQRVLHELVSQARLLADAFRGEQIEQPIRPHVDALDETFAHEPFR